MWPFKKHSPAPDDIVVGPHRAQFSTALDHWEFVINGVEFTLSGRSFDPIVFDWGTQALAEMQKLKTEIDQEVLKHLEGWPCDKSKREILSVSLDDYAQSKSFDIAFTGDGSWGDYGINVIIAEGKIIDAYGGD